MVADGVVADTAFRLGVVAVGVGVGVADTAFRLGAVAVGVGHVLYSHHQIDYAT